MSLQYCVSTELNLLLKLLFYVLIHHIYDSANNISHTEFTVMARVPCAVLIHGQFFSVSLMPAYPLLCVEV